MIRFTWLLMAAALATGCVSSDDASNGALRILHASPDAPRLSLYFNDNLQGSGLDYSSGSAYLTVSAGTYQVRIEEVLPADADPATRVIFNQPLGLSVNDEVTLVVVGEAAVQGEEVLNIPTRTRGVPTGRTRLQAVHAAVGAGAVDVYLLPPDVLPSAVAPLAAGLAYKSWSEQTEITSGTVKLVVTASGDPLDVLLESDDLFLPLESTLLIAVVRNTGLDAAEHPVIVVISSGSGSATVADKDTPANLRLVNASPGSYALDGFVNSTVVDDTARQECDPGTDEADTFLEKCALPYEYVGSFDTLEPQTYDLKFQKTGDAAVSANSLALGLAPGGELTVLVRGLLSDTATTTDLSVQSLFGARRVATAAQLRLVDVSIAADAAVEGDPTTDRLEIYITAPCALLVGEDPDFFGLVEGSDTGLRQYVAGDYQVTFARTDTAQTPQVPEILLSKRVSLANNGIYTLLIADSSGGVQPLKFLSVDDDAALADCPVPP